MKFGLTKQELTSIIEVLQTFPEINSAYIFGSRATDSYTKTSDIDLMIEAPNLSFSDFLALKVKLHKLSIIYTIDVVHFERISSQELKNEIETTKKLIYQES
ncbi:MAG: nucleotidyltransferase domain-containing protein [Gammaproteobacteria bacterium]